MQCFCYLMLVLERKLVAVKYQGLRPGDGKKASKPLTNHYSSTYSHAVGECSHFPNNKAEVFCIILYYCTISTIIIVLFADP